MPGCRQPFERRYTKLFLVKAILHVEVRLRDRKHSDPAAVDAAAAGSGTQSQDAGGGGGGAGALSQQQQQGLSQQQGGGVTMQPPPPRRAPAATQGGFHSPVRAYGGGTQTQGSPLSGAATQQPGGAGVGVVEAGLSSGSPFSARAEGAHAVVAPPTLVVRPSLESCQGSVLRLAGRERKRGVLRAARVHLAVWFPLLVDALVPHNPAGAAPSATPAAPSGGGGGGGKDARVAAKRPTFHYVLRDLCSVMATNWGRLFDRRSGARAPLDPGHVP